MFIIICLFFQQQNGYFVDCTLLLHAFIRHGRNVDETLCQHKHIPGKLRTLIREHVHVGQKAFTEHRFANRDQRSSSIIKRTHDEWFVRLCGKRIQCRCCRQSKLAHSFRGLCIHSVHGRSMHSYHVVIPSCHMSLHSRSPYSSVSLAVRDVQIIVSAVVNTHTNIGQSDILDRNRCRNTQRDKMRACEHAIPYQID